MIYRKNGFRFVLLLLVVFVLINPAFATTSAFLDSTEKALGTTTNNNQKLVCLYTLSFEYGLINPKKGIDYGWQCLKLAVKENNLLFQLNGYNGIANAFETLSNFDSALFYHRMSYVIAQKMKSPTKMALTLFNVGLCYKQLGQYKQALHKYLTAYKLVETSGSYNPRIHFYFGEIYLRMANDKEAERHSLIGIKKCLLNNQEYVAYNMQVNLAKCLVIRNQVDTAISILHHSLVGLKKHTDELSIAACYNALGQAYLAKKEFTLAYNTFNKELQHQQKINNQSGVLMARLNLAFAAAKFGLAKILMAQSHLQQFEKLLLPIKNNPDVLLEAYSKASEAYELINQPKKAAAYFKQYHQLRDLLLDKEKYYELMNLQAQYETEKKEQQIKALEQKDLITSLLLKSQADKIKSRNTLIVVSFFALFTTGLLVYFYFHKQKFKTAFEKELAIKITEEKERLRMAKDIHDDLGSGLSKISFLSEMIIREKTLDNTASDYVSAIAETSKELVVNMRDLIWALTPDNITLPSLVARIREYSTDYLEDFSITLTVSVSDTLPNVFITQESHREILMTIKESLNNIVKHAKASIVQVEINLHNQQLVISVKDNGVGIPSKNLLGNGIKNMHTRIENIGGMFLLKKANPTGTSIQICIPLKNMEMT